MNRLSAHVRVGRETYKTTAPEWPIPHMPWLTPFAIAAYFAGLQPGASTAEAVLLL
jgi:hypothetical protein